MFHANADLILGCFNSPVIIIVMHSPSKGWVFPKILQLFRFKMTAKIPVKIPILIESDFIRIQKVIFTYNVNSLSANASSHKYLFLQKK